MVLFFWSSSDCPFILGLLAIYIIMMVSLAKLCNWFLDVFLVNPSSQIHPGFKGNGHPEYRTFVDRMFDRGRRRPPLSFADRVRYFRVRNPP